MPKTSCTEQRLKAGFLMQELAVSQKQLSDIHSQPRTHIGDHEVRVWMKPDPVAVHRNIPSARESSSENVVPLAWSTHIRSEHSKLYSVNDRTSVGASATEQNAGLAALVGPVAKCPKRAAQRLLRSSIWMATLSGKLTGNFQKDPYNWINVRCNAQST